MVLSEARFLHDSDSSDAGEDIPLTANYFGSSKQNAEETKGWDVFEDPPIKKEVGSLVSNKKFEVLTKIVKVIAYILTFCIVLACGVISKGTMLFMTSQLKKNRKIDYCNRDIARNRQFISIIPEEQRLSWAWALIFVFMAPELGTFIRSFRICVFKTYKTPSLARFVIVLIMESLHTLGLAMLVFVILPELDVVKGVMLTNCFCFIPAVFGMLSRDIDKPKSAIRIGADVAAICAQVTGFVVWPLLEGKTELYFIPLSVVLISCGWWENYVLNKSSIRIVQQIAAMKDKLTTGRYFTYLFVAPWKCLLFFSFAIIALWTRDENISHFFSYYSAGFGINQITLIDITPVVIDDSQNTGGSAASFIPSTDNVLTYVIIIQVLAGYICYVFGKFACKIVIQGFSYALPICLTVPVCVSALIYMCGMRYSDPCYYHNIIPPYLFFNSPPLYSFAEYITEQHAWIWIFWLASQVWITLHIWTPQNERLVATEKIFVTPMYNGLLVDQSLAMNRKQHDIEPRKHTRKIEIDPEVEMRRKPKVSTSDDPNANEKTSRVIVCGTMWHENKEEMIEFLKSIMRLDEDQCSRRIAKQYFNYFGDTDYYEVETHVFFDDAFTPCKDDPSNTQINSFVKLLINTMDEAASEVHQTHIRIRPPKAYPTPYGGRLIWTLPGKTLLIAHLKDKDRIRHKKRWSQVMYMYYMLGYRLMDLPISKEKKDLLAKNTYILALDGDIDFKPQAVLLLIDLMKRNANLAAACGRIHPVGTGPMVWYQKFEYAIGHWLQKATEHMIGCVLCSPGCFSLFRAEALMDKNIMKRYTTKSDQARHFVQYDQGEDRWLCTLLLQRGWRVEYSAASDAYTHCPEGFNEFYNQRRRWIPSTMANIFDLLLDAKRTVKANPDISHLYIFYQIIMMAGSILGPGTIFLMLVGAFVAAFKIDNWTSFTYNLVPILIFMAICLLFDSKIQLFFAGFISAVYGLVMIAVIVGLMVQISEDGPLAPSSLFFFIVAGELIIAAMLHPQEIGCLPYGLIYYVTVPSMYMLLIVYAAFNMNDVSWGTREVADDNPANKTKKKLEEEKKALEKGNANASTTDKILNFLKNDKTKEEQGSVEFSFAGLFKCMLCTHDKNSEEKIQLIKIANSVNSVSRKLERLERTIDPSSATRRRTTINSLRGENGLPPLPDEEGDISISESDDENMDQSDIPKLKEVRDFLQNPYWLDDPLLNRSQVDFLPDEEKSFWSDLIQKYLDPIKTTAKEEKRIRADLKDLRDKVVFAFFMLNSLFVLVIFLLQMNKDLLHIRWPLGVKSNVTFDSDQNEITIKNHYLELEPIGVIFLLFFALVLVIQFTAMLFHRMGTLSHILAIAKLNIFQTKDQKRKSAKRASEITVGSDMVELARRMMSLKFANEVDEEEDEDTPAGRRKTIHHLESLKNRRRKVWKLEEAFNLRYEDRNITDNKKVFKDLRISTQDLKIIEKRRTTIVAENVAKRKSQMHREAVSTNNGGLGAANPDFESRGRSGFEPYFPDTDTMRNTRPKFDKANDIESPK